MKITLGYFVWINMQPQKFNLIKNYLFNYIKYYQINFLTIPWSIIDYNDQ